MLFPISLFVALQVLEPAWSASFPEGDAGSGAVTPAATTPGTSASGAPAPVADLLKDPGRLLTWLHAHNMEVAAASSRVEEARAGYHASRLLPNPTLSYSLSDIVTGASNPQGLGFHETSISTYLLSETAEIGKRGPRIASANALLQATIESYLDTLAQKAADARYALGRAYYLKSRKEILERSLTDARRVLQLEKTRLDQGEVSGNDYDRLLLDTTTLQSEISRNTAEYQTALAACRAAIYAECDVEAAEIDDLEGTVDLPAVSSADESLKNRPDLRSLDDQRESARMDLVLARRRRIPDPGVGIGYTHDNLTISGDQPNTLTLALTVPLPIFDRGQHDAARAAARATEIEAQSQTVLTGARADLEGLSDRKAFLESTVGLLQGDAVPRSAGILDTTLKAFDQGEVAMTDLLLARRNHTNLLLSLLDLRFESFTVRNELRRVLGLDAEIARKAQLATAAGSDNPGDQQGS